jgi:hypothetical protein
LPNGLLENHREISGEDIQDRIRGLKRFLRRVVLDQELLCSPETRRFVQDGEYTPSSATRIDESNAVVGWLKSTYTTVRDKLIESASEIDCGDPDLNEMRVKYHKWKNSLKEQIKYIQKTKEAIDENISRSRVFETELSALTGSINMLNVEHISSHAARTESKELPAAEPLVRFEEEKNSAQVEKL